LELKSTHVATVRIPTAGVELHVTDRRPTRAFSEAVLTATSGDSPDDARQALRRFAYQILEATLPGMSE
jgi:hypothetical protein